MADNKLYYGDNLDILRKYVPDGSIDLVYLDPPFKSNADYKSRLRPPVPTDRTSTRTATRAGAYTSARRLRSGC